MGSTTRVDETHSDTPLPTTGFDRRVESILYITPGMPMSMPINDSLAQRARRAGPAPAAMAVLLLAAAILVAHFQAPAGACDPGSSSSKLPFALTDATAVSAGDTAYIFGGSQTTSEGATVLSSAILSFDRTSSNVSQLSAGLPLAVKAARSFWDGQSAWIFSGVNKTATPLDYLVKFTPPDKVEYWEHFFPYGLKGCSVAWTGRYAYLFGNCVCTSSPGTRQNVIMFDPATPNATVIPNVIPVELAGSSAVCDGKAVYLFAGRTPLANGTADLDCIMKFDPAARTCVRMNATFPSTRYSTGAILNDGKASVFGGDNSKGQLDEVWTYDIGSDRLALSDKRLSTPMSSSSYAIIGDTLYIFAAKTSGGPTDSVETVTFKAKGAAGPAGQPVNLAGLALVVIVVVAMASISLYARRKDARRREMNKNGGSHGHGNRGRGLRGRA